MTWVWPVELVYITSPFNPKRKHPISGVIKPHNGADFRAHTGTPIYAVHSGVVTLSGWNSVAGNWVWVAHEGGYRTQYHHLSKRLVAAGQRMYAGQQVGLAGATGQVAGAHLHFEVRYQGVPIDPVPFLTDRVKPPKPQPEPEPEPEPTHENEDDMNYRDMIIAAYHEYLHRAPGDRELSPRLLRIADQTTQEQREARLRAEIAAIRTSPEALQKAGK